MPKQKVDADTIIQRALHLFKTQGYHATSMADLGEACGLLKGSIYHYFSSKEALALAVMDYVQSYFASQVFSFADDASLPPAERMKRLNQASENYFLGQEGGCLMGNLALEVVNVMPQFKSAIEQYFNDWAAALCRILLSRYPEKEAASLSWQAVAEIQGGIMMMRLYGKADYFLAANRKLEAKLAE